MTLVVGLSAKAQHGKGSTVQLAQIKRQSGDNELEIKQVSFATELKEYARAVVNLLAAGDSSPPGWMMSEAGMKWGEEEAYFFLTGKGLPGPIAIQVMDLARGLTDLDRD